MNSTPTTCPNGERLEQEIDFPQIDGEFTHA
jgi:hypothetical protein